MLSFITSQHLKTVMRCGELTPFYTTNHTDHMLLQFQTWPVPCKTI